LRLVIDTNVVVTALRSSDGASAELLRKIRRGEHSLLLAPALFLEYEEILKRAEHLLALGLQLPDVDRFLSSIAGIAEPVDVNYHWRPQLADAEDEMVIEAAINGRADALVTFNGRHFQPAADMFGLQVMTPGEILRSTKS
jgi:putative PIN family toxin of toxin-antitoxin system